MKTALFYFWYWRIRLNAWWLGIIHWHITPKGNCEPWEVLRDFYYLIIRDRSKDVPNDFFDDGGVEQDAVMADYARRYQLTQEEQGHLHMAFSPYRVPKSLSRYQVKFYIARYERQHLTPARSTYPPPAQERCHE